MSLSLVVCRCLSWIFALAEIKDAETVSEQAFNDAAHSINTSYDGAYPDQEARHTLQAHGVLDADRRELVSEEDRRHSALCLYCLRRSEPESFECLRWLIVAVISTTCFVHEVNLADLQKVIYEQTARSHEVHHPWLHEFLLLDLPSIQLKIEFFAKVLFNVLNIAEISETKMIDLM